MQTMREEAMSVTNLPPHADKRTREIPTAAVLCSEPWHPCWELATFAEQTEEGYVLTCKGCANDTARPISKPTIGS